MFHRKTIVDPLAEAFPGQSAYSYAFNSPLSWSDPSGLAPEMEKKRDRVLGMDMEKGLRSLYKK
jgi:hypothetical protein